MGSSQSAHAGDLKELKVVVVGMPGSGAKSLVTCWTGASEIQSKLGWQSLERSFEKIRLQLLALGSERGPWSEHIPSSDVLAFVVDGSSEFDEVAFSHAFNSALSSLPEGAPVLLLVNKVDADPDEEATKMADSPGSVVQARCSAAAAACSVSKSVRQCKAFLVSAKTGYGCDEVLRAMCGARLVF